jgi:hypothetical protein
MRVDRSELRHLKATVSDTCLSSPESKSQNLIVASKLHDAKYVSVELTWYEVRSTINLL